MFILILIIVLACLIGYLVIKFLPKKEEFVPVSSYATILAIAQQTNEKMLEISKKIHTIRVDLSRNGLDKRKYFRNNVKLDVLRKELISMSNEYKNAIKGKSLSIETANENDKKIINDILWLTSEINEKYKAASNEMSIIYNTQEESAELNLFFHAGKPTKEEYMNMNHSELEKMAIEFIGAEHINGKSKEDIAILLSRFIY